MQSRGGRCATVAARTTPRSRRCAGLSRCCSPLRATLTDRKHRLSKLRPAGVLGSIETLPRDRGEVFGLDRDVREAFDEYVRARGPQLVRTAYLFTGDATVAEDVVQNALASLVASWRRLRDVANLDAYVYRSVVNAGRRW